MDRRPAAWPWLLLPLVALTIFFLLKTAKDSLPPSPPPHVTPSTDLVAPSVESESH